MGTEMCKITFSTKRNQIKFQKSRFGKIHLKNIDNIVDFIRDVGKFGDIGPPVRVLPHQKNYFGRLFGHETNFKHKIHHYDTYYIYNG
jgi:hypothetical protein